MKYSEKVEGTTRWFSIKNSLAGFFGVAVGCALTIQLSMYLPELEPIDSQVTPFTALDRSIPVRLEIPRLEIIVPFGDPLGVSMNGEVLVPARFDEVGWYQYGPTPGEQGPAVVLGHIDSYHGPAVFYSLGQLEPGDDIFIERADGQKVRFVVKRSQRYEQASFPSELVYGDVTYVGLRLVTCSGRYNYHSNRYSHNLVVYAEAVTS